MMPVAGHRRFSLWPASVLLVLSLGCRTEAPPAAIEASGEVAAPEPTMGASEGPGGHTIPTPSRDLWFAQGPGRAAIIARERKDHVAAVVELDALLAQTGLSASDRAAAQWLRGLEHARLKQYEQAAERFAEAAKAKVFASMRLRLRALEAQARLDASQPDQALELLNAIAPKRAKKSVLAGDLAVMRADALMRTDQDTAARQAYADYLKASPKGRRRAEVKIKLARLLAEGADILQQKQAIALYEELLLATPLSDFGEEAQRVLPELRKRTGTKHSGAAARRFAVKVGVGQVEALLKRRRYTQSIKAANKLLKSGRLDATAKCKVLFAKGTAIFKRRKRKAARPVFDQATAACKSVKGQVSFEVRSRYQAARGLYAAGRYKAAALAFESLAKDHRRNSYADDAWVLAGESWSEHGDAAKARAAFGAGLKVGGDMQDEARRRLLVMAFSTGRDSTALRLCDDALKHAIANPEAEAKLHYFRGRALHKRGNQAEAVKAWHKAVKTAPLGYSSLWALARLREVDEAAFAVAVADLAATDVPESAPTQGEGAKRALILARLGLGDEARQELKHADVNGWPAVAVLTQAGLYSAAQRTIANLGSAWRRRPPTGTHRSRWELAYPLPFGALIERFEQEHGNPHLLAYAVMQTESRFDPGATSWAGARGLIQLMPGTAKLVAGRVGVKLSKGSLYQPEVNLNLGMHYLAGLVKRYGGEDVAVALAVPSYNAGAGAVDRWLAERGDWDLDLFVEAIPYDETRRYTQSVLGRWWAYRLLYGDGDVAARVPELSLATPKKVSGE